MNQSQADYRLTLDALAKIVAAQRRGTLSAKMSITRYPTQIVLGYTTETDRAWVAKHFPGTTKDHYSGLVKKGRARFETHRFVALLRLELEDAQRRSWNAAPRIEVWDIEVPHVCREFKGSARRLDNGNRQVVWRCAAYGCKKPITKTKARELGLLP